MSKYESTTDTDTSYHIGANTTEKIRKSLEALPPEHKNNYTEWFKTTCAMREIYDRCNQKEKIFDLWDEWSKTGRQYDKGNNTRIFHNIKSPRLNVNFIFKSAKETFRMYPVKHEFDLRGAGIQQTNNHYVTLSKKQVEKHKTFLIKSPPGTGKTTFMKRMCEGFLKKDSNTKILSIVSRVSLCDTHKKCFQDVGIKISDYATDDISSAKHLINWIVFTK